MVSSVENAIMEDKSRNRHRVTPKELLVKSNPSLYAEVDTNRQMNNMISNRRWEVDSHSKDDSHVKPMSNLMAPGPSFPFLSRTNSMNNLHHYSGGKMLRKQHSHSNHDLSGFDRKDHSKYAAALHRQQNYSMEDLRHVAESDKENRKSLHFPAIRRERTKTVAPSSFPGSDSSGVNFPNVRSDLSWPLQNGSNGEIRINHFSRDKTRVLGKPFVHKLEKWFSEIPSEEYEKADQSRNVENSDSSKSFSMRGKQRNVSSKSQWKVPVLKPMQNIPNKYLELRKETNTNGIKDTNINRDQYKLRQKSLLQLKMNSVENRERTLTKTAFEVDEDLRQYTFHTERYPPTEQQHRPTLEDLARARKQTGDGVGKIDIGEFAIDAYNIKPNSKFNFANLDPNGVYGSMNGHSNSGSVGSNDSGVQRTPERGDPSKTAIVNLEMSRSRGSRSNQNKTSNDYVGMNMANQKRPGHTAAIGSSDVSTYNANPGKGYNRSKSVLSKFNTLEVFGNDPKSKQIHEYPDHGQFLGSMLTIEENGGSKKPVKVPVYKLDLKTMTKRSVHQKSETSEDLIPGSDNVVQEIPTLSLEFRTGEVVVNRKSGVELSLSSRNKPSKRDHVKTSSIRDDTPPEFVDRAAGSAYHQDRLDAVSDGTMTVTPELRRNIVPNTQEQLITPREVESEAKIDQIQNPEAVDEGYVNGDSPTENINGTLKEPESFENTQENTQEKQLEQAVATELTVETSRQHSKEKSENDNMQIIEAGYLETIGDQSEQIPLNNPLEEKKWR
ncbi:uncharacterized protein LOC110451560 [Mizuhopecten yessoensis]|uniref:uncharacterized protein LOC110451560 n=1 Tax=Mizuhopecten yessoensis TaxID=6573 RepID=UPI000B45DD30|nr:uncharacterized protein LOC110451560 [Mizuhopecten yessoensis]XP_021355326.1 uncharacterized protein LOC110451560 [Mizuhopecten yessoensis]